MNHIYKVIWNTITQTWVAVSELSRAKGKTKSSKTLSAVVLAAVSAGAIVGDAEAAIDYPQGTHLVNGMAIGTNSYANRNSVAYGVAAKANDGFSVAIGANAVTERVGSGEVGVSADRGMIAIGSNSVAKLEGATAIGSKAEAAGQQSTAVGNGAQAKGYNSSAFGEGAIAEKNYGVAVGKSANAKEQLGIAVGKNASAENYLSTAVGAKTEAKGESSIAIGSGDLNGGTDLDAPEGAKATGNASMAVGASAKATADNATALGKKANASGQNSIAVGAGAEITPLTAEQDKNNQNGNNGVAIGASSKATHYSTAVGSEAKATGKISSAFGDGAQALSEGSSAFGSHANVGDKATGGVALGRESNVTVVGGVALGQGSKSSRAALDGKSITINSEGNVVSSNHITDKDNSAVTDVYAPVRLINDKSILERVKNTIKGTAGAVSLGNDTTTRQLTNLAPGSADSDAVNVAQLKAVVSAFPKYSVVGENGVTVKTDPENSSDPRKWKVSIDPTYVKNLTKWQIRDTNTDGNPNANVKNTDVTGGDVVTFQDTDTIDVERDGKTLKFHTKKNIKYFSVNSSGGTNEDNKGATGDNAIAIGKDASSSANNAVVIGKSATALKNNERYDLNVGTATSNADSAVVIGNSATSKQARTVAIGNEAQTLHTSAIAIGDKAYSNGARGIAIGRNAQSTGNNSIALGAGDQNDGNKTTAEKDYAVAIGSSAVANIANGIALGSQSKTTQDKGQVGFDASQDVEGARTNKYDNLKNNVQNVRTSTLAGISIGDTGKTRQINHLAAGTADDDAVNVAQLKSVNLAFKGDNNTKGDVRLHDQRLSVVGATNDFITTKAIDNKLEIGTKQGTFSTTDGKSSSTASGLATTNAVASTINQTYWQLQENGSKVGDVNPGDKVNIASGNGITVTSTKEANGVSKITINATVAGIQAGRNVTVETTNGSFTISATDTNTQASVSKAENSPITIKESGAANAKNYELDVAVDGKTISKNGGVLSAATTDLNVSNKGGVENITGDDGKKLVNATTVAKIVGDTYWTAKQGEHTEDNAESTNVADSKIKAGDELTFASGKNMALKKDGNKFIYGTKDEVTFTTTNTTNLAVNPNGKFTVGAGSTINMGNNIVGGVAKGVADTDAVNVAQLKANTSVVSAGDNITVTPSTNAEGNKVYTVAAKNTQATVSKADGDNPITLDDSTKNANGTTNYKVGLNIDEGTLEVKNGKLAAKAQTKAIEVVESKEDNDNIAKVNVKSGKNKGDAGATYQVSVTKNDVKDVAKEAVDVRGSNFITVTPTDEMHLKAHTVAAKTGTIAVTEATGAVTPITTATGLVTDKTVADAIAKSGFQLKQGDETTAKTVINPGDSLTFKDGQGTKAVVNANGDVQVNADVASLTGGDNVTVKNNGNGSFTISATDTNTQASVSKAENSPITIKESGAANAKNYELDVAVDGKTISKNGGVLSAATTDLNVSNKGGVENITGDDGKKLVNATTVAKIVGDTYWTAKQGEHTEDNAESTNVADSKIKAGDELTFASGKNMALKKDGNKFIYGTKDEVTFTTTNTTNLAVNPNNAQGATFTVGKNTAINMGDNIIHGVANGVADTDAVNVAQLKSTERHITPNTYTYNDTDKSVTLTYTDGNGNLVKDTNAKIDLSGLASKIKDYSFKTNATGSNLVGTGKNTTVESGKSVDFAASYNLTLKQDVNGGNVTYTYGLKNQVVVGEKGTPGADGKPGKDGVDGSIGVNGKDGSAVAINGKDGSIGLNGKDGKNGLTIKGQDGKVGVDGKDGETRLVYVEKADPTKPGSSDKTHELATLDDGQKYAGDNYVAAKDNQAESNVIAKKANERLDIVGGAKGNLTEGNIGVNAKDGKLHVQLAEKVNLGDKGSVTIGDTVVNNNGITINSPADLNGVTNKTVSLTNQGLNNGGNKITNVAEGENDTDAVNVKQLKDFKSEVAEGGLTFAGNSGDAHKAKLNSTVNIKGGEGNTDADQFDNGKNVMTKVNGNTVTVSIKKTPEVEGINIIDTTGKVKVKLTQTDEGLKVSDGNNNATRITNVKAGEKDTDAVNVKQLNAAKTEVTAGDNIDVRSSTGANGQTIYKVSANDTSAAVEAGSDHVKVTKAANTHKDGSTTVTDYTVDLSDKTKGDIGKGVKAYDKVTNEGLTFNADKGSTGVKKLGSKVSVNGDGKNITTTADENGVKVSMKDDIKVNSVTAKEVKVGDVNINENGINAGGKRITNVAPGKDGTDAVNVNQLKYVAGNISNQINNVDKGLRAGIAGALASGGLYHVTTAGKSMVSVGAGTYRGQNALAVGYSRLSDNGKVGVKFTVNSNSQGHAGASASVGYQW